MVCCTAASSAAAVAPINGTLRTYFIAAVQQMWDYAPLGYNGCTGKPFVGHDKVYVHTTPTTLGSRYIKAVYREFTDDTFTALKPSTVSFPPVSLAS